VGGKGGGRGFLGVSCGMRGGFGKNSCGGKKDTGNNLPPVEGNILKKHMGEKGEAEKVRKEGDRPDNTEPGKKKT